MLRLFAFCACSGFCYFDVSTMRLRYFISFWLMLFSKTRPCNELFCVFDTLCTNLRSSVLSLYSIEKTAYSRKLKNTLRIFKNLTRDFEPYNIFTLSIEWCCYSYKLQTVTRAFAGAKLLRLKLQLPQCGSYSSAQTSSSTTLCSHCGAFCGNEIFSAGNSL